MCFLERSLPMFSAAPASPSLVDTAIRTGRAFRKWLFTAIVTLVSAMLWESFANVFPVQGAMINMSSSFFGPMGSTSEILRQTGFPQISSTRRRCSSAVPKRLSVQALLGDRMGTHVWSLTNSSKTGNTFAKVQKEPHIQKPIFIAIPP